MPAPYNVPVINAPIVQAVSTASGDAVAARDGNGDCAFTNVTASAALGDAALGTGIYLNYEAKTASYTAVETDTVIGVDATSGAATITLPAAASNRDKVLAVKKTDSSVNAVTIDGNGAETLDSEASIYLTTINEVALFICDGTNWRLLFQGIVPGVAGSKTVAKAANFTAGADGRTYIVTVGAGGVTATLPPAAQWNGKSLTFKRADAGVGNFVLDGNAAETIDGAATLTLSATQYTATTIVSDGTNWHTSGNKS